MVESTGPDSHADATFFAFVCLWRGSLVSISQGRDILLGPFGGADNDWGTFGEEAMGSLTGECCRRRRHHFWWPEQQCSLKFIFPHYPSTRSQACFFRSFVRLEYITFC